MDAFPKESGYILNEYAKSTFLVYFSPDWSVRAYSAFCASGIFSPNRSSDIGDGERGVQGRFFP